MREVTLEQVRDMADAHWQGLHDDAPREFCPECDDRSLASYPLARDVEKKIEHQPTVTNDHWDATH